MAKEKKNVNLDGAGVTEPKRRGHQKRKYVLAEDLPALPITSQKVFLLYSEGTPMARAVFRTPGQAVDSVAKMFSENKGTRFEQIPIDGETWKMSVRVPGENPRSFLIASAELWNEAINL